ncbi:MAG: hypothetical protein AAFU71_01150 [Cyanobacteria bacterium J06632_22]
MQIRHIRRMLNRERLIRWLMLTALVLTTSCSTVPTAFVSGSNSSDVPLLSLETVEPAAQLGTYLISGQAQLPDQTPITISAMRTIKTGSVENDTEFYAILDRQQATLENRQWSAQLQLLQSNPGGGEQWQAEAAHSAIPWRPQAEVTFTATLEPSPKTASLQRRLSRNQSDFERGTVRISDDGEPYAIATQTITIDPPQWEPPAVPSANEIETRVATPSQTPDRPTPENTPPLLPEAMMQ